MHNKGMLDCSGQRFFSPGGATPAKVEKMKNFFTIPLSNPGFFPLKTDRSL